MIFKIEDIEIGKTYGYSGLKGIPKVKINNIGSETIFCESVEGCSKGMSIPVSFYHFYAGNTKLWELN
jgi:hypothetical protein